MAPGTKLLNDDGSASMSTLLMMSHHGLRRDLLRLQGALRELSGGDTARLEALRDEWQSYHATLHGHHSVEDASIFPDLRAKEPRLAGVIDELSAQHRQIDPLLERGDAAFRALPDATEAEAVVAELLTLLDRHLSLEEAEAVPFLRGAKEFPAPQDEATLAMYAAGFAWSMHGIASQVLDEVRKMLPESLLSQLPAAQAAFDVRCQRVFGPVRAGASLTSVPD